MTNYSIKKTLDAQGLICPEPIMMLHSAVRDAEKGDIIEVLATDQTTKRDIHQFCEFLGHELLESKEEGNLLTFYVRKS